MRKRTCKWRRRHTRLAERTEHGSSYCCAPSSWPPPHAASRAAPPAAHRVASLVLSVAALAVGLSGRFRTCPTGREWKVREWWGSERCEAHRARDVRVRARGQLQPPTSPATATLTRHQLKGVTRGALTFHSGSQTRERQRPATRCWLRLAGESPGASLVVAPWLAEGSGGAAAAGGDPQGPATLGLFSSAAIRPERPAGEPKEAPAAPGPPGGERPSPPLGARLPWLPSHFLLLPSHLPLWKADECFLVRCRVPCSTLRSVRISCRS